MPTMGRYCKAYEIKSLRGYSGWSEKAENARKERAKGPGGQETEVTRPLTDDGYLYLQENYVVTDGIFKDENIIFDAVTPAWIAYCQEVLKFEIPAFVSAAEAPPGAKG